MLQKMEVHVHFLRKRAFHKCRKNGHAFFIQHLDLSGSPIDSRCCDLISDLESLRILRLENCPGVDTASVVSILARRSKTLAQFECGNKLQG